MAINELNIRKKNEIKSEFRYLAAVHKRFIERLDGHGCRTAATKPFSQYLGEASSSPAAAAADEKNIVTKRNKLSEANFFGGELALRRSAKDEAIGRFKAVEDRCPKTFVEWSGANAELKAIGAAP